MHLRLLALVALCHLPACAATVKRCAPIPNSDSCEDLSMSPHEGDVVDAWFDQGDAIKMPVDRCAYWTKRTAEAPRKSDLADFCSRMREHECRVAANAPKVEPAAAAAAEGGSVAGDGGGG